MTNFSNTTFYIGITNNLERRVLEHRSGNIPGFTKNYRLTKLVYFEHLSRVDDALIREKQLKNWHRTWKINLIKEVNPDFSDLFIFKDAETSSA